ncbi:MAG: hypothetical protein COA42_09960 [Alteromonadaceae bacterium]|nr:MAG: hypothetical protein COA42_09960 [Alteromonadaceae bacterium]
MLAKDRAQTTILVVDDQPAMIRLINSALQVGGFRVIFATSGPEALTLAQGAGPVNLVPDLILLDVVMPEMDGFETCRQLKNNPVTAGIPVIFVTGNNDENDETHGFECGACDYIHKPISPAVVLARINTHIQLTQLQSSLKDEVDKRTSKLNETLLQLEQSNRVKDAFLATISHEMRTPLNGIEGSLALMELSGAKTQYETPFNGAQESTSDLTQLIDNVLCFTEMQSSSLVLSPVKFSPAKLLKNLVARFDTRCKTKKIEFVTEIDLTMSLMAVCDKRRLRLIVQNILDNALKFTKQGKVHFSASLLDNDVNSHQAVMRLVVSDTGAGISSQRMDSVYTALLCERKNHEYEGLCIGLALCRFLVDKMQGTLQIDSDCVELNSDGDCVHGGTKVIIELPIDLLQELAPEMPDVLVEGVVGAGKASKILIVEDNLVNQLVLKGLLDRLGHNSQCVDNGKEALEFLNTETVDVILMDVQMPEMDGLETTRRLRQGVSTRSVPIIAITANAMSGDRERCIAAGMNDYLSKPVTLPGLMEKLSFWL